MTIDQAYSFCKSIANKDRNGIFTPDQFNLYAPFAHNDAINKRLKILDKDQSVRDELAPILKTEELNTNDKGVVALPDKYLRFSAAFLSGLAEVDLLTSSQFGKRELSQLKGPSDKFPIAKIEGKNLYISPKKTQKVNLTYIEYYQDPNWDYNFVSGSPVFNKTLVPGETGKPSSGFSLASTAHNEICFRILQYLGVQLSHDMLLQYGLTSEQLA